MCHIKGCRMVSRSWREYIKLDYERLSARFRNLGVNTERWLIANGKDLHYLRYLHLHFEAQVSPILTFWKLRGMMARSSSTAQRNLTLMEELEKLEQSITLTLQGTRRLRVTAR